MPESPQEVNQNGLTSASGTASSSHIVSSAQLIAQRRQRLTSAKYYDIASTLLTGETDLDELFLAAARDGDYDKIEHFLQGRTDVIICIDVKDKRTGNTPLIWAAKKGHVKIVHLLLKHGADPTLRNYEDETALEVALPGIKTVLLDSVEKVTESPHRLLLQAAWQGNSKVVHKLLMENKVLDINCQNAEGLTPLLLLTRDVLLFERTSTQFHRPYSPVHVLQELLNHRADVHATDGDDKTCLHYAAQSKATVAQAIVSSLISCGSEMDVRDKRHFMPIHCASKSGNTNVIVTLVEGGSEVNSRGYAGLTPLHISAYNDHLRTAKSLLQQGADVMLTDDSGLTAVDLAKSRKMRAALKEAWTDATDKRPSTSLSPVRAPSREQSRQSTESMPKRRKGEVIFDGLQINAISSQGPGLSRSISNAEKARRAEQLMMREIESGRFTPTPRENIRKLGQLRNKPAPLPQVSQSSAVPGSPDSLSPSTPALPRPLDDVRRSLEDGRHIGQKGRLALLSTSSSALSSSKDKDVSFCIQNNREHSHIILEDSKKLKTHKRSGSDPFSACFGDVASSCDQYLSRKARSQSTSSYGDEYDEDPLKMMPLDHEPTCLNIPTTIPEVTSPRVNAVIIDPEDRSGASRLISLYPTSSRVLPPTPVPTFITQKSFSLLDGRLVRQDKQQSPRSNDELPKISHDPVKAINGTNLLRSHTIFKDEFILEESRPKDPLLQSSGSDPTSSASSLSSSSPRDMANIVFVHKNSSKMAKGRISPLIKYDIKQVGFTEKSDSGHTTVMKTRTKVGRSQSFNNAGKKSVAGRKLSDPESITNKTADSTPRVESSECAVNIKFSKSDTDLDKQLQGIVPQLGKNKCLKGKGSGQQLTVLQNGKKTGNNNVPSKNTVSKVSSNENVKPTVNNTDKTEVKVPAKDVVNKQVPNKTSVSVVSTVTEQTGNDTVSPEQKKDINTGKENNTQNVSKTTCSSQTKPLSCVSSMKTALTATSAIKKPAATKTLRTVTSVNLNKAKFLKALSITTKVVSTGVVKSSVNKEVPEIQASMEKKTVKENIAGQSKTAVSSNQSVTAVSSNQSVTAVSSNQSVTASKGGTVSGVSTQASSGMSKPSTLQKSESLKESNANPTRVPTSKPSSDLSVPKSEVDVVVTTATTTATTSAVKNIAVASNVTRQVSKTTTVTQSVKSSSLADPPCPKPSTRGPSPSHRNSAAKNNLSESAKKSSSNSSTSNCTSILKKNNSTSVSNVAGSCPNQTSTTVSNVAASCPNQKSEHLKSHLSGLASSKVGENDPALTSNKPDYETDAKPLMKNPQNSCKNWKDKIVSTPKEPLVRIICPGERVKAQIVNNCSGPAFTNIHTPVIVNPYEDLNTPDYNPNARPVKNATNSNAKVVSNLNLGCIGAKSTKDATYRLKSQSKSRNIKSAKRLVNNKDAKRPVSSLRQPSGRRRGGKKLADVDEGKVKSARGKRVRSARKKKVDVEAIALAENAVNPEMALISGIGWHVAANCVDTSDVKVAKLLSPTDSDSSDGSDVEMIETERDGLKVQPGLTDLALSPGTPRFLEVKRKTILTDLPKNLLPVMTNDGFAPMNLDMTQKHSSKVKMAKEPGSPTPKKTNTKEEKFTSKFDDLTNQVHKEIMLNKINSIPQSASLVDNTVLAIHLFDQAIKDEQLDKLLGINPNDTISSCRSTSIKQGLRNEAPSGGKRASLKKKMLEDNESVSQQTVAPGSERKLSVAPGSERKLSVAPGSDGKLSVALGSDGKLSVALGSDGKLSASKRLNFEMLDIAAGKETPLQCVADTIDKNTLLQSSLVRESTEAEITHIIEKYANLKKGSYKSFSRSRRDSVGSDDFDSDRRERKFSETKKQQHDDNEIDEAIEEILNSTVGTSTMNSTFKSNKTVKSLNNTLTEADRSVLRKLQQSDSIFHAKHTHEDDMHHSDDIHHPDDVHHSNDIHHSADIHNSVDVQQSDTFVDETNPHLLEVFHADEFKMGSKVKAMIDAGADESKVKAMLKADEEEQKQLEKVMSCVRNMELQATVTSTSTRRSSRVTPQKGPLWPEQSLESPHISRKPPTGLGLSPVGGKFQELKIGSGGPLAMQKEKTICECDESPRIGHEEEAVLEAISKEVIINPSEGETMCSHLRGRRESRTSSAGTVDSMMSDTEETIQWKKGNVLGRGAFGVVWCGLTNEGGLIAVKQIELNAADHNKAQREYEKVQEEVELLKNLRHKNIVGYLGTSFENDIVSIFMQFVPGGSIASILARFGALDESVFRRYTKQILEGVEYLHHNDIIHRDIKGGNVMLMPNGVIKLIDFGCAKRLWINLSLSQTQILKSMKGTPYWMAPEVVNETGHGKKSDIWSVGCTVFEMATKKPPWANVNPMAAIFAIGSDKPIPPLPEQFSDDARHFVKCCLTRDQIVRSSASELLQHPFIVKKPQSRK